MLVYRLESKRPMPGSWWRLLGLRRSWSAWDDACRVRDPVAGASRRLLRAAVVRRC